MLAVVAALLYRAEVRTAVDALGREEAQRTRLVSAGLSGDLGAAAVDLLLIARGSEMAAHVDHGTEQTRAALAEALRAYATLTGRYDQLRYFDENGVEVARVIYRRGRAAAVEEHKLRDLSARHDVQRILALAPGQMALSPVELNTDGGKVEQPWKPVIRLTSPVVDQSGRRRGAIMLTLLAAPILDVLERGAAEGGGQTMLLDARGYWLRGPDRRDEFGYMFPDRADSRFGRAFPEPWRRIEGAEDGQFEASQGLFTFVTVDPVRAVERAAAPAGVTVVVDPPPPAYPWKVVSRVSPRALAARRRLGETNVPLLAALLVVLGAMAAVLAERGVRETRAFAELRRAEELTDAAMRSRGEVLGLIGQEIRAPVAGLVGASALLLAGEHNPEQRELIRAAAAAARSLLATIDNCVELARIRGGTLHLDYVPFRLREMLAATVRAAAERAREKGMELVCDVHAEVPNDLVGDPARLGQVIGNLAANAVRYAAHGEVVVEVTRFAPAGVPVRHALEEQRGPAIALQFAVRDTGVGIPPAQIESLFAAVEPAGHLAARRPAGLGIGLVVARRLVEMMGGTIWVDAVPGRGSAFAFTARFHRGAAAPREAALDYQAPAGQRALIADDSAASRRALARVLTAAGLQPMTVAGGVEAQAILESAGAQFGIAVVDAAMPGLDGIALCRWIAAEPRLAGLRVVLLTVGEPPGEAERRALGLAACVAKPVAATELLRAIGRALDHEPAGGASGDLTASPGQPGTEPASLHLLVAEDDPLQQLILRRFLVQRGHAVVAAGDGKGVLDALDAGQFDAVLMSVEMPSIDGIAAAREIRRRATVMAGRQPAPRLPIIGLTARSVADDGPRCAAAGMDACLAKPPEPTALVAALAASVRGRPTERG